MPYTDYQERNPLSGEITNNAFLACIFLARDLEEFLNVPTDNSLDDSENVIFKVEPEVGGQDLRRSHHPAAVAASVVLLGGCKFVPVVVSVCFDCGTNFPSCFPVLLSYPGIFDSLIAPIFQLVITYSPRYSCAFLS